MAIKQATKPTNAATAGPDPDGIPAEIPRHGRDGRPKIRVGSSAKFGYYSRASSFGKVIEDTYNLDRWDKRVVVWGLSRDESLRLAVQSIPAWEDRDDPVLHKRYRDELNKIVDAAREVAKSDRAAMRGTALHLLSEQADAGADLSHLDESTRLALATWRRMMGMFELVATEVFVVHDEYGAAGSADRVGVLRCDYTIRDGDGEALAVLPAGTAVVIDLKTGRSSDFWGVGYAVQLAVYAGGTPYVHLADAAAASGNDGKGDDGRRPWPGGHTPHPDWALIPHVPVDNPSEAGLVWVDLRVGRYCAELVSEVKAARKAAGGAFYAGPVLDMPGADPAPALDEWAQGFVEVMLDLIGQAGSEDELAALHDRHAADWRPEFTEAVRARLGVLEAGPSGPSQVELVGRIRACTTAEQVGDLYAAHVEQWTPYVGKVASAHVDSLAVAVAS